MLFWLFDHQPFAFLLLFHQPKIKYSWLENELIKYIFYLKNLVNCKSIPNPFSFIMFSTLFLAKLKLLKIYFNINFIFKKIYLKYFNINNFITFILRTIIINKNISLIYYYFI